MQQSSNSLYLRRFLQIAASCMAGRKIAQSSTAHWRIAFSSTIAFPVAGCGQLDRAVIANDEIIEEK